MPLQQWSKGQFPEGMGPIPPDTRVEIEAIRDLLAGLTEEIIIANPLPASTLLLELHERLDIAQRACSLANSFVAQQDIEVIRQRVQDDGEEIADMLSGKYTATRPLPAILKTIAASVLSSVGDLELVLEENGQP